MHGTFKSYDENGKQVMFNASYKHGEKHGKWTWVLKSGKVIVENYINGERNGYREIYKGDKLESRRCYKNDQNTAISECDS